VRARGRPAAQLELLGGAFIAWLAITITPHHDIRYDMPLMGYLAVIGTGWITRLPQTPRLVAILLLAAGVLGNTLAVNFGVGREVQVALVRAPAQTEQHPDQVVFYSPAGFLVAAPSRDGDVPALLEALHRDGVRTIAWSLSQSTAADFSLEGLLPLARIAGLAPVITQTPEYGDSTSVATLLHKSWGGTGPAPCTRLSDGTGVWVVRYDAAARKLAFYCPSRAPRFYDPGAIS
jgi:hypothetical protein